MVETVNFNAINQSALSSISAVLSQWCPGGTKKGVEYVVKNPTRNDGRAGSFSINTQNGTWADFATEYRGGDLISLVAYIDGVKQIDAAKNLAGFLNIGFGKSSAKKPDDPPSTGEKNQEHWECVMPIPHNSPKPPLAHNRHGRPSKRYSYQASSGVINYYHDRYEAKQKDERKQFAPLTLWQNNKGLLKWRFKAPPDPRPLYGLNYLFGAVTYQSVWLVEGEKAADIFNRLFDDLVAVTWQGGSKAVTKADFSSLANMDCIIWPDNDESGIAAAFALQVKLKAIGARSVKVVSLEALANQLKRYHYALSKGDDVADLVEAGLTSYNINSVLKASGVVVDALEKRNALESDIEPTAKAFKRHFTIDESGVYLVDVDWGRGADAIPQYKAPRRVCNQLELLAKTRATHSTGWGVLVRFRAPDKHQHRFVIPAKAFNGEGLEATGILYDSGLQIEHKSRQLVLEYIESQAPDKFARTTNRIGWHHEDEHLVYVMPNGAIGGSIDEWIFNTLDPNPSTFKTKGTLQGWRDNVASLAIGNSRLVLAISLAFAAPLKYLAGLKDAGGLHLRGSSSDGKSTALRVGASVCGGANFVQTWRSTDNALEKLALKHSDGPMFLDELKQLDPRVAGETAYMLSNGVGKNRATEKGHARETAEWRVMFLSAGEISLSQHMQDANKRIHAGQEIRMIDIPVDAGRGLGCFENLHGMRDGNIFAQGLNNAIASDYGHAFPAFIEWIQQQDKSQLIAKIIRHQSSFVNSATNNDAGQVKRVASVFGLIAVAGEFATLAGITGWQTGAAYNGVKDCFNAWLGSFGDVNREEAQMLKQVRLFLENHGEGRFADIDRNAVQDDHSPRVMNKAGYRKHKYIDAQSQSNSTEWWVYPEVFKEDICKGFDYRTVAKLLVAKGCMEPGDGKGFTVKKSTPEEGRRRVFVIKSTIFESE